ncbi:glutamine--fructose-6-phosphate transaminase (isomerizing) [Propionibacterium freudenreichii]|uniref:Glutamine--fructose-6-phosphate aminotransferase [isomerizing] n=2 Tax=Propionibacterium freudenreichii TaxID=1744 RepID=D7GJ86_PROFC|nr:glutamine--fructose-6-phosphate transaminase (isomerizing) [Propionibacterium freudenreichii]MDN5961669.1 glutamine--fructose-6-phosphate transaminase (isomerizing) [Propionibacterium sp.]MCQ1996914.1 glutamine--fructose-6-phosphate transaminase (isomerizing) [Propionibacterium freudenreichii]MCT2973263.1 glutamine--fructose-6-phosphate transaminase (isomerizing) [Propionibacterium freudenreichii]MCT2975161.1 glutamine--fructose-6-phosphate transaminase (isomerizing) [Propionibacterium freud
MCGIIGYIGPEQATGVILDGLRRLEYRGYDSAGIAVQDNGRLEYRKKAGKLANLDAELAERPLPESHAGIGHTRWATHGVPNDANAHPQLSNDGRVAVVHNGIIENFATLRAELGAEGVEFTSDTDTEVAAALLGRAVNRGNDLTVAMREVSKQLHGAFTLVAIDSQEPDVIVAARRNSPLVVGVGQGENFVASDVAAFIDHTREAIELGQDQVVTITANDITVTDFDGGPAETRAYHVDWDTTAAEKDGYDWFMRKEIFEQPKAISDTLLGRYSPQGELTLDEIHISPETLRRVNKIIILGCGTAHYAGMVAKYAIEHWVRIPCEVELASEFRYRDPIVDSQTLCVAISQSGETADTLQAIRHAREQGAKVIAICNTNGSTIPRESDAVIYTYAGPEIGVASTKGFTTQLIACYLLGLYLAQVRGMKFGDEIRTIMDELEAMPAKMQSVLDHADQIYTLAKGMEDEEDFIFIGRHVGYPIALEGALKLKEIAYLHAEGFAAGELKHGPIAIINPGMPVFAVVPPQGRDQLHDKVVSNIQEVRARGARTIAVAEQDDNEVDQFAEVVISLPKVSTLLQPVLAVVPLQLFACEIATLLGNDVDQPRNLAKSVTVE